MQLLCLNPMLAVPPFVSAPRHAFGHAFDDILAFEQFSGGADAFAQCGHVLVPDLQDKVCGCFSVSRLAI